MVMLAELVLQDKEMVEDLVVVVEAVELWPHQEPLHQEQEERVGAVPQQPPGQEAE